MFRLKEPTAVFALWEGDSEKRIPFDGTEYAARTINSRLRSGNDDYGILLVEVLFCLDKIGSEELINFLKNWKK